MLLVPSMVRCLVEANRDPVADVNTDWRDKEMESRADYSGQQQGEFRKHITISLCSIQ